MIGRSRAVLTICAQLLSNGNLVEEVRLLLLDTRGETLLLGLIDDLLDGLALVMCLRLGVLFCAPGLLPVVAPQLSSELGLASPGVVEVDGVGWREEKCTVSLSVFARHQVDQPGHARTEKAGSHCSCCCSCYDGCL